jgi:uncharacterized membrane protein YfcA
MNYLIAMVVGFISGVSSGLFGVGGGVVMVPAMMLLMKFDIKQAVGTSLAVIVPTTIIGTIKHTQIGNVDWRVAFSLAPTAVLGGYVGAAWTKIIPSETLKMAFGGFLILVGLRLLIFK